VYTLLAGTLLSLALTSQSAALPGRYTLDRASSDDISALVEQAARDAGPLQRNRVRSELRTLLTPAHTLQIEAAEPGFVITADAERSMRAVPGESDVAVRSPNGEPARRATTMRGYALVVRVVGARGSREQVFEATAEGLVVTSTYVVSFRREPIRQRTVYRREAP
jgi:hypothetical protein